MYPIGLSTCGKCIDAALFTEYAQNGIAAMELSLRDYTSFDFPAVAALARASGVQLWSLHLPFSPFDQIDLSSCDDAIRAHTLDAWSDIIRRAAAIGIDKFVVHAGGEPIDAADRPARMQHACTSLAHMADVAAQCGAVICVEDLPRTCLGHSIAEMQTLVAADPRLRVCIDTNHVTVEPPEALIRALGDRLVTLHVSDFDFVNERHWLPGEGKIAWPRVLDALRAVDYRGVWLYEIGFACPKTIFRDRPLTCADFARNAQELFAGKAPTVFSTQKPNLGMWE